MKERSKSNLITILILLFELVIFVALGFLIQFIAIDAFYWLYVFMIITLYLFYAAVLGYTTGYLGYQNDALKIAIGMMLVNVIVTFFLHAFFYLTPENNTLLFAIIIILTAFAGNSIIFLTTNYSMKRNLQKNGLAIEFEIIEETQSDSIS